MYFTAQGPVEIGFTIAGILHKDKENTSIKRQHYIINNYAQFKQNNKN